MAQTAVDLMDAYLGMKDGPEKDFSQTLQDRRDESIGTTETNLVTRLVNSVTEAFQNGQTLSDADRDKLRQGMDPQELFLEKGITISDADRAKLIELYGRRPQPTEIEEITEIITESPAGAAALDETMQLPSAMELAQMGMGYSSGYDAGPPELREGLGTMIDEAQAAGGQLSKYEQMLLLASLGIPAAALGGRAVGGLMSKLGKGGGRGGPKLGGGLSAMRDMGPQAGNLTGAALALQKLGRPIPGRSGPAYEKAVKKILGRKLGRPIPPRSGPATERILGGGNLTAGATGLASLKKFMGKENLRRPQVSKMAGAKFVDPNHKKVFTRAFGGPKDNTMYMWSDDAADYFKDTITRKTFKVPRKGSLADDLHDYPQW